MEGSDVVIFSIGDAMNFERKKYKGTKTKEGPWLSPVVLLSHGSFFIWRRYAICSNH